MKAIEDMTLKEIRELKEKYHNEFRELINKFFKEHPYIDYIRLYESGRAISIKYKDVSESNIIQFVKLKGERI